MTDKEFKRLTRADLIEIIYRLQENEEKYRKTIAQMILQLEDRQTKIQKAGSIAEATVALSNVFGAAQEAADQYLEEIRMLREEAVQELERAKRDAAKIRTEARRDAGRAMAGEDRTR